MAQSQQQVQNKEKDRGSLAIQNNQLDIIIFHGEFGFMYTYGNVSADKKIQHIQEFIQKDIKIDIANQFLTSKTGFKIQSDDILGEIERDNALTQTQKLVDSTKFKTFHTIYVFNEKNLLDTTDSSQNFFIQEQQNQMAIFSKISQDAKKPIKLDSKFAELDYQTSVELTEDQKVIVQQKCPNVIDLEQRLFKYYTSLKRKTYEFTQKQTKLDKGYKEVENQQKSIESLLMRVINEYQISKSISQEVHKKLKDMNEVMNKSIQKYEESLSIGKSTDLPEALKKDNKKYLYDVYYDVSKMDQWKLHCIKEYEKTKKTYQKESEEISKLKKQIKEQQSTIQHHQTELTETIKKLEEQGQDGKNQVIASFIGVYEEYKNLRKFIQSILDGCDDYAIKNFLDNNMLSSQDKLKESEKTEKLLNQFIDFMNNQYSQIWEQKLKNFQKMQQFQQKFSQINIQLNKATYDKIKPIDNDIAKNEREFSELVKPYKFFTSFKQIIKEVSRRNEFNSLMEKTIKVLNDIGRNEYNKRSEFIGQYGRCIPKDFIPELNLNVKPLAEIFEKLPKIENEHDDKYADLFKQIELPDISYLQEQKIMDLKRELQVLKDQNSNAVNGKGKKDSHTLELEQQISEQRNLIIRLKNELDMLNIKKKEDNANAQVDLVAKKNVFLQEKVNQLESQLSSMSNANENNKVIQSLQKQLEELDKAYQNIHLFYQKENKENIVNQANANSSDGNNAVNSSEDGKTIQKLNNRISNLTILLQQSAKVSFNSFLRQQTDKYQKLQDKIFQQEQKLLNNQEDFLKEKNKLITFYEDKIKSTDNKYYSENNKIQSQYEQQKDKLKDEINNLNARIKQLENDYSQGSKQLKNSQDQIARLNSQISQKQKEYDELNKKSQQTENKLKADNVKQVSDLQTQLKSEQEKYKKKLGSLETDLANKQTIVQNQTRDYQNLKRDLDLKNDEFEKVQFELDNIKNEKERVKRDVTNLKNKIENMEQVTQKKTSEITQLNKNNQTLINEKLQISEELQKEKTTIQDYQKRLQTITESVKQLENERSKLIQSIDHQKLELEKKKIEIDNLNKQVYDFSNEKALQMEKLKQTQMNEKLKLTDLNEEVQQYKIEINLKQTKMQILEADLQARDNEIKILKEKMDRQKNNIEENEEKIEELVNEQERLTSENEQKNQEMSNINAAYEQALIEIEIQEKNSSTYKQKLEEKEEDLIHQVEIFNSQINELNRNIKNCQEREKKTNSLNQDLNLVLSEIRQKLSEKEQELSMINEEMSQSKNTMNLKEMSLKQMNVDIREKDETLISLSENIKKLKHQLEESQRQEQIAQQETENLMSESNGLKQTQSDLMKKNQELQRQINDLQKNLVELQNNLQQLKVEKELVEQNNVLLEESQQKLEQEKHKALHYQNELMQQYDNLKSNTICLDVHNQALEKLEIEMQSKEQQVQDIIKEQGQLAQELITAETSVKNMKKQIHTFEILQEKHLQTISELTAKLNIEKKDSECQWEEAQDEKNMTLSTYEAQKFRKLLKSIDYNKKIPVLSQKNIEHIDITQALKKTAIIQDSINFTRLEEGTKMLFIPSSNEVYVPLILKQLNDNAFFDCTNNSVSSSSLTINSYKNNYYLDFDTLDKKYKDLLNECSLLMVANIKNIIPKQVNCDNNPFGLKENESYFLLQVEQPEYIVGLEDDDHSIKNYA